MALRPISFDIPRRETSPIEDAFRVALTTAAAAGVSALFAPLARRTEVARARALGAVELEQLEPRLDIQLEKNIEQARRLGAQELEMFPARAEAQVRAQIAARTLKGKEFVTPATESVVDRIRRTLGASPTELAGQTTLAEYEELAPVLSEAVAAGQLAQQASQLRLSRPATLLAGLQQPAPDAFQNKAYKDPSTDELRLLTLTEQFIAGNLGELEQRAALTQRSGDTEASKYFQGLVDQGKALEPNLVTTEGMGLNPRAVAQDIAQMLSPNATPLQVQQLQGIAGQAANAGILLTITGEPIRFRGIDDARLLTALKANPQLVEAVYYSNYFADAKAVRQAERLGLAVPQSPLTRGYLQEIFKRRAQQSGVPLDWQLERASVPAGLGTQPPTPAVPRTPQVGETIPPSTPLSPLGFPLAPPRPPTPAGGGQAPTRVAPVVEFAGTPAQRRIFDAAFAQLAANPAMYQVLRDSLDSAHRDFPSALAYYRRKTAELDLPPETRQQALDILGQLESLPPEKQPVALERLKWQARLILVEARDAAARR